MSTYTSEPGTRLAGRYRLVDQVSSGTGWTYWKATDETLARSVTVLTFATGFPRVTETVTAARAASRLGDPRFAQVFDVEDGEELAYVVLEWVSAESLIDMLSEGPLDPARASALMVEAARAIAVAHDIGLAHLRLDPACLHWTAGGGVKIAGLGIDAALAGPALTASEDGTDDPELTDTRDLARLLYAALTGYWPGLPGADGSASAPPPQAARPALLPPAPENGSGLCTPRQVSAGVPAGVDDVTCRALFQRPNRHGPALSTAATFADALASAAPPVPLPFSTQVTPTQAAPPGYGYQPDGSTSPYPPPEARPHPGPHPGPRSRPGGGHKLPGERSTTARAVIAIVIVLVLAAVGVAAWSISRSLSHSPTPAPSGSQSSSQSAAAAAAEPLTPASATVYNPLGSSGDDDPADAPKAIDGNASTFWHTSYYLGHQFGNLKKGTGLILDMGRPVRLSQLTVQFGTSCCTHVMIEVGNSNTASAATLSTFTAVQSSSAAQGSITFNVTKQVTGRYVLIWITDLPPLAGSSSKYETLIYDVTAHGFASGQPG
jgi:serine/threonine protein kinase